MAAAVNNSQNESNQFVLIQIFGKDINKKFSLKGSVVQVGRTSNADVRINGTNVSRKHCILKKQPEGWTLKDCDSQSGTYINGRLLERKEIVYLKCGDIIFLGPPSDFPTAFQFEASVDNTEHIWVKQPLDGEESLASSAVQSIDSQFLNTAALQDSQVDYNKIKLNKDTDMVPTTSQVHNAVSSSRNFEFNKETKSMRVLKPKNTSAVTSNFMLPAPERREYDRCSMLTVNNQEEIVYLKSKLDVLSEEIKKLEKSKSDLQKENEVAYEKNKLLDLQLIEQNKLIEDMLTCEKASKTEFKNKIMGQLEEDLICNICSELLIKPTVLDCSHTFCEYCIKLWEKEKRQCPVCRKNIQSETRVLALDNYIDKTLEALTPEQKKMRRQIILDREQKKISDSTPAGKRRRVEQAQRRLIPAEINNVPLQPLFSLGPYGNNMAHVYAGNSSVDFPWRPFPNVAWY